MENIKIYTGDFYEVIVKHPKIQEDGTEKVVKETIAVKAFSFTEAEKETQTGFLPEVDIMVANINPAPYHQVFISSDTEDELFFKCKVAFLTIDETTEKEKRTKVSYLVQASSTKKAQSYLEEELKGNMIDYKIEAVAESSVSDIFNLNTNTNERENTNKEY